MSIANEWVIDAILRGIETEVTQRGDEMEDALQDLNALMAKAKEMVRLHLLHPLFRTPNPDKTRI